MTTTASAAVSAATAAVSAATAASTNTTTTTTTTTAPVVVKREFAAAAPVVVKQEEKVVSTATAAASTSATAAPAASTSATAAPAALTTTVVVVGASTTMAAMAASAASAEAVEGGEPVAKKARIMPTWGQQHMKATEVKRLTLPIEVLRTANALSDTREEISQRQNACVASHFLEREVRDVLLVTDRTFTNDEEEHRMYMELRASAEAVKAAVFRSLDGMFLDTGDTGRTGGLFHNELIRQATELSLTFSGAEAAMHFPEESDLPEWQWGVAPEVQ